MDVPEDIRKAAQTLRQEYIRIARETEGRVPTDYETLMMDIGRAAHHSIRSIAGD